MTGCEKMKSLEYLGFTAQQITALWWLGIAFTVIFCAIVITLYLLNAIALYRISKKRGVGVSGIAFLPIVNAVLVDSLASRNKRAVGKLYLVATVVKIAVFVWGITSLIETVAVVLPLAEAAAQNGSALLETQIMPVISNLKILAIFVIAALIKKVFYLFCFNEILRCQGVRNSAVYTALCVPFGFLAPVFLYSAAKREEADEQ